MALEVRHNRAQHTHENEQFRRIAPSLTRLFKQKGWNGLLIGNPTNETYGRFRADAILLYNHGLIIIDLKDYSGTIHLPSNDAEFQSTKWYSEGVNDKQRIEIKAGAKFINPFRQLKTYREEMYEIIRNNIFLNSNLNPARICAVNIFSGPIDLINKIPRSLPYYKVIQESELSSFLYDLSSDNSYCEETASALKVLFPAELWEEHGEIAPSVKVEERIRVIDDDVKSEWSRFLKEDASGILILESMHAHQRDDWMRYVLREAVEFKIPQTEVWTHSARIGRKLFNRTGISLQSLYNTIYGGASIATQNDNPSEEDGVSEDDLQEVVPLKSDNMLDESAVVILHEAHLVTRSLHQTEFLKFGSGRLLEDLIKFLSLEKNKRKLICIGDPYSLSFGKEEGSALNIDTLKEIFHGSIQYYRQPVESTTNGGKIALRTDIASHIDKREFNNLAYPWKMDDLVYIEEADIYLKLKDWFSSPVDSEPDRVVLTFSNKQSRNINLRIKSYYLKNGEKLAVNDLLLVNNNIVIPDPTGFGQPSKLYNGTYLQVKEIKETLNESIKINQISTPVILSFTKLRVICLSLPNKLEADVWLLNNYFSNDDNLSKNEQISFRVFVNNKINEQITKYPFKDSSEYKQLIEDIEYQNLSKDEKEACESILNHEKATTTRKARSLLSKYRKSHRRIAAIKIAASDPLVNAIHASYGWALTVHKSIGSFFSELILNAYQGENRGVANPDYYKWLYSAVTAAGATAFIANPQKISPLMQCHFEDSANEVVKTSSKIKFKELAYSAYEVPERFADKMDDSLNSNIRGAICDLSKLLEPHGYLLESILRSGAYLTKAIYSIPHAMGSHLIIAANNNGKGLVSSIRIERAEGASETLINDIITSLFSQQTSNTLKGGLDLPTDFRQPIYEKWTNLLEKKGWQLNLVESHAWNDIFIVKNGSQIVKFRLYYNADKFFTKFIILEKTEPQLGLNLQGLLLNGN